MIINGESLISARPVNPMEHEKKRSHGVSYGLSEAGYDVRIAQNVILHPFRRFKLASTFEHIKMPVNAVGVVHDKSTFARRKLSVFNTVLEPGWEGWVTLELVYHGNGILRIPAGSGIAQILFHQLEHTARYTGKYQDQPNRPVAARME